ncbi:hypothetical protein SKUN_001618 [Spiroplasma kunkelii CR2-3x]|uniref:Uncharacterized protein n=1 Tax=Spiroplasma kunkelii CR2-3x TaxID=273035 RepID=A0A0K2JIQ2_SPIKU|nr:hypothetical protein [Spiroplasma kunkelii]ALA98475.1 hypothetical protein SKUN_001618 [Spiroplasma kunkelii CR2-3x]
MVQKAPRLNKKYKGYVDKWLFEYGLNFEQITKISTDEWYKIMTDLHKKGIAKKLLLNVNLMRANRIYKNKLVNFIHKTPIKNIKIILYHIVWINFI